MVWSFGIGVWDKIMVYVDDYNYPYRGMKMCHMIADSDDELEGMAIHLSLRMHRQEETSHSLWSC